MTATHTHLMQFVPVGSSLLATISIFGFMLDEKVPISIGAAFSLGGAFFGAVWWIGRKFQALEDGQEQAKTDRESVYKQLEKDRREFKELITEIFNRLNRLPCRECEEDKPRRRT